MYVVQFSGMRSVEYTDRRQFEQRVRRWLLLREGENTYVIEHLTRSLRPQEAEYFAKMRMFTVEEKEQLLAVGLLLPGGCLCMTWATEEISEQLIGFMLERGCQISSVYAPGHIACRFAERWATQTKQVVEYDRSERVYQVSRVNYELPAGGRLRQGTAADQSLLVPWTKGFIAEANKELGALQPEAVVGEMLQRRLIYLWEMEVPVAMAAWIANDGHHSINFVYVPPVHRGKGYGKAVSAALASHIIASGNRHCFILTDTHDELTNHVYESIGGHGVGELLRCTLRQAPPREAPGFGRLNVQCGDRCCPS